MYKKLIFVLLAIMNICTHSLYAQEETKNDVSTQETENIENSSKFTGYFGLYGGTPGAVDFIFLIASKDENKITPGFMFSFAALSLLNESSSDTEKPGQPTKDSSDDSPFWAIQIGAPVFLYRNNRNFISIGPVAGFGYYRHKEEENGIKIKKKDWWIYCGPAIDLKFKYFYCELGIGFGKNNNFSFTQIKDSKASVLARIGIMM
jgi:hypothetical protein